MSVIPVGLNTAACDEVSEDQKKEYLEKAKKLIRDIKGLDAKMENISVEHTALLLDAQAYDARRKAARMWWQLCIKVDDEYYNSLIERRNRCEAAAREIGVALNKHGCERRALIFEAQSNLARARYFKWTLGTKGDDAIILHSYDEHWIKGVWARITEAYGTNEEALLAKFMPPQRSKKEFSEHDLEKILSFVGDERKAASLVSIAAEDAEKNRTVFVVELTVGNARYHGLFGTVEEANAAIAKINKFTEEYENAATPVVVITDPKKTKAKKYTSFVVNLMKEGRTDEQFILNIKEHIK